MVVYLLFSRHFRVTFWRVSTMDRDRLPAWSCPLNRAVYSTPHNQCVECLECLEWIVLYIPFIHFRHNAKDRSLGVGRDIIHVLRLLRNVVELKLKYLYIAGKT